MIDDTSSPTSNALDRWVESQHSVPSTVASGTLFREEDLLGGTERTMLPDEPRMPEVFFIDSHDVSGLPRAPNVEFMIHGPEFMSAQPEGATIFITKVDDTHSSIRIHDMAAQVLVVECVITHHPEPRYPEWHNPATYAAEIAASFYWGMWRRNELRKRGA